MSRNSVWTNAPGVGGAIDGVVIGGTTPAAITGTTITATGRFLAADGTVSAPGYSFTSDQDIGIYRIAENTLGFSSGGASFIEIAGSGLFARDTGFLGFLSGAVGNQADTLLSREAAAVLGLQGSSSAVGASLRRYGGNAGYVEWGSVSENLTLSTSGTTTDTAANLLPANSYIESVTNRITTTIATATDWKVGDPTTSGRFTAANATLTAGTTSVGLVHCDVTGAGGPRQTAAAKVRVTTTGTPSAGAIRLTSYYRTFVAPTS